MLESEALKKWCPHVRLADCERGFGYNRWDAVDCKTTNNGNCIGSACMMWEDCTPPAVILDSQGKLLQDLYYDLDCAESYAKRYGKYKAVPVEGKDNYYEYHYDGDIQQCGDCGLKTKESGCGYPG